MFAIREKTQLILFGLLLAAQLGALVCQALKVSVHIPELVKLNDAFWLNCTHQQQQSTGARKSSQQEADPLAATTKDWDDIYAIKWYKDDEEFYRFLPNGQPKVSIYETNGIQLDQTKSHEGNVYINKADVNSEGIYRCEILSEAPVFETVRKSKQLKVYALPIRGPRIEILDSQGRPKSPKAQEISYAVGDKIELRCNSAPSKPAAKLRWYLNEHEITIPPTNATSTTTTTSSQARNVVVVAAAAAGQSQQGQRYEVRVTPMEFRQHYKSIYSSHSTLSLVLRQDDLINNKISFKCLASMRQEVPLRSKQLIVLMPASSSSASSFSSLNNRLRARRQMQISTAAAADSMIALNQQQRQQRPQNQRHSVTRLQPQPQPQQQQQHDGRSKLINNQLFDDNEPRSSSQMMYIYEEANAALGSTIIDTLEALESYLLGQTAASSSSSTLPESGSQETRNRQEVSTNYAGSLDNLDYIQSLRSADRAASSAAGRHRSGQKQRLHGSTNALVRSPFYLDENEPLRPIISWPPLEAGKLQLLGGSLVAQPTLLGPQNSNVDQRFLSPSKSSSDSEQFFSDQRTEDSQFVRRLLLEKLAKSLNCTCSDGSSDTRLSWLINDQPLDTRDTRFYPNRSGQDHRQTIMTIGLVQQQQHSPTMQLESPPSRASSPTSSAASSKTLKSLLAGYFAGGSPGAESLVVASAKVAPTNPNNEQLRFACQAIHSMLLHSSSEMITFDFNPPINSPDESSNSIVDKFSASSSNVIQASTSASQSSSACSSLNFGHKAQTQGSQSVIFLTSLLLMATLFCLRARTEAARNRRPN